MASSHFLRWRMNSWWRGRSVIGQGPDWGGHKGLWSWNTRCWWILGRRWWNLRWPWGWCWKWGWGWNLSQRRRNSWRRCCHTMACHRHRWTHHIHRHHRWRNWRKRRRSSRLRLRAKKLNHVVFPELDLNTATSLTKFKLSDQCQLLLT